jgi:GTP-binding protein
MSENTQNSNANLQMRRNIAIIAHVDHGKTTLVDQLLRQSGTLKTRGESVERVMDSNELEKERGITILAKNTAINWKDYFINIVDTPGHADFGGEVERVLSMVDSVLLLVDAVDGPMPQTRFVTQKAFEQGLKPIVVINKVDRVGARADWVIDQVFDLFVNLNATDEQLDFPIIYASAINGYCMHDLDDPAKDMAPLFETIISSVSAPDVNIDGPFQMQISALNHSNYLGTIGLGRVARGKIGNNKPVHIIDRDGNTKQGKILQIYGHLGLERKPIEQATAGDIVCITGIENLNISDTICELNNIEALPSLSVDEPTVTMTFQVNTSPFAGKEGKYITSRHIKARLEKELVHNVALRVEETDDADKFKVSGRGELHLSILIEQMRREGFELAVSRPEVITKEVDGQMCEPYEYCQLDIETDHQGVIMEILGERDGDLKNMMPDNKGRINLEYVIPAKSLIGFHTEFLSLTKGTGLMSHIFDHFGPVTKKAAANRTKGVLISGFNGKALGYSLFNLQERGQLIVSHGEEVYEGMLIGIHSRNNDLVVNPTKAKQLTNIRAAGTDENIVLTTPLNFSLEQNIAVINNDELVEITPKSIRLRKKLLSETDRKRVSR